MTKPTMGQVTCRDGAKLVYLRQGTGPIVVLVHGGFLDHRAWNGLTAILAQTGHTVIVPDRRGHGHSDPYGAAHRVSDDADDLARIINTVAKPGSKVRVVAHSSGSHSALAAALLSDQIDDLVLYEPPQRRDDPPIQPNTWKQLDHAYAAGDRKKLIEIALRDVVGKANGHPPPTPLPPPFWDSPFGQLLLANALAIPAELRAHADQDDTDATLQNLTIPMWCLVGGNSPSYNRRFSDRIAAVNHQAKVVEMPEQDHGSPVTNPAILADLLPTLHLSLVNRYRL